MMCQGKERLEYFLQDYKRRKDSLSKKEQDTYSDMQYRAGDVCQRI